VIGPDGAGSACLTRLTHDGGEYPAWSPDGTRIVLLAFRRGCGRLYVVNVKDALQDTAGSDERRVTNTSEIDRSLTW
jgi:Tol biopolymer transport system component